jgi:hypothetical protein
MIAMMVGGRRISGVVLLFQLLLGTYTSTSDAFTVHRSLVKGGGGAGGSTVLGRAPTRSRTALGIGGMLQGLFGKKEAEITDTVYFDIAIDGKDAG